MRAIKLESWILSFVKAPIARAWIWKAFFRFEEACDWLQHAVNWNAGKGKTKRERAEDQCYINIMYEMLQSKSEWAA